MPRKKLKLDDLNQTHGKVENKPITLDQIWGDDGKRKYGTLDINEYDKYLKDLNKSDLQQHAIKIGLVPIDDRETLVKRLKTEFKKYVSMYLPRPNLSNKDKLSKKSKDILSEGR
jgi:hypothetical protein